MNIKSRIVPSILLAFGLISSAVIATAQVDEDRVRELEARIVRLEARIAVLEKALAKTQAPAEASPEAAKHWTVADIKAAVTGKTPAEVKVLLGAPDQVQNTLWAYSHMVISDPVSGTDLNFLVLEFVGNRARVYQLKKS
jgi:hypothetical protein